MDMRKPPQRKNQRREGKGRLNIWLEKNTLCELRTEARRRCVPVQRIAETCLSERYKPKEHESLMNLILRRLNMIESQTQALERLSEIQAEMIALLASAFFPGSQGEVERYRPAARQERKMRYDVFVGLLAERLREDRSVLSELPGGLVQSESGQPPNANKTHS